MLVNLESSLQSLTVYYGHYALRTLLVVVADMFPKLASNFNLKILANRKESSVGPTIKYLYMEEHQYLFCIQTVIKIVNT